MIGIPAAQIKPFSLWQYGFDAAWELDLWGRVRRELESAEANLEASAEAERILGSRSWPRWRVTISSCAGSSACGN